MLLGLRGCVYFGPFLDGPFLDTMAPSLRLTTTVGVSMTAPEGYIAYSLEQ